MARQVKLQDTGEIVSKDKAYQAPNRKYYSSEEAYLMIDIENNNRNKCTDMMYDFMGYLPKQKLSTYFFKKVNEWHEGYSYSTILRAMEMSKESIEYSSRTKRFDSEGAKLSYFMAIINNKLNDAWKIENNLKRKIKAHHESGNLEQMIDGMECLEYISKPIKGNDVSKLAGEL